MKKPIISALCYPYDNQIEVKVIRGYNKYDSKNFDIRVYTANYRDFDKTFRLIFLATKLSSFILLRFAIKHRGN